MARTSLLLFILFFGLSCFNEPDCIITASSAIKIDFKQTKVNSTTLIRSVVDSSLIFTSVWVSGVDTAYFNNKQQASVTLPVDPRTKTIKFIFNTQSRSGAIKRTDSIRFTYASESRVIAPKCGAYAYFLNLKVMATSYDSTKYKVLSSRLIKNTTNVQVFY